MALEWRYTYSGTDNGLPDESLGGSMSATQLNSTPMNNLFDDVSVAEAASGDTEYRCLVLYANGTSHNNIFIYMSPETSSPDTQIDLAWEGKNPSSPTTIADESTAPNQTGWEETTFTHRNSASKLSVTDVVAGDKQYVWFKRIVNSSASGITNDLGSIKVEHTPV